MTTKPPSEVKEFSEDSIEKKAYRSVADIPTREMNDRNRLAYHVWKWLTENKASLGELIAVSGARLLIGTEEAKQRILEKLKEMNVDTSGRKY